MQIRRHLPVVTDDQIRIGAVGLVTGPVVNPMDDQPGVCAACAMPFEIGEVVEWTHDTSGLLWVHQRDIVRDARE